MAGNTVNNYGYQHPDGRLLMSFPVDAGVPPNIVITNWLALLEAKTRN